MVISCTAYQRAGLPCGTALSGQTGDAPDDVRILTDLILEPRVHSDDHRVFWLNVIEGKAERRLQLFRTLGRAAGGEDLESKAGFPGCANHLAHPGGIAFEED